MKKLYVDAGVEHNGGFGGEQKARICIHTGETTRPILDEDIGNHTNNEAEIIVIKRAIQIAVPPTLICSDSQIAVNMITGKWKGKAPNLRALVAGFTVPEGIDVIWISRDENEAGHYLENIYGI